MRNVCCLICYSLQTNQKAETNKTVRALTKDRSANESSLDRLRRLEAVLATEDTQLTVMVTDKLELAKSLAAAVAEVRLAA